MTSLVDGQTCLALKLLRKSSREIILSFLFCAGLATLALPAGAQQRGYNLANLTFDSISSGSAYQGGFNPSKTGKCDRAEFSGDNDGGGRTDNVCYGAGSNTCTEGSGANMPESNCGQSPATPGSKPGESSKNAPADQGLGSFKAADFNRDIYYKNRLEFSLDGGWLPINIPFAFDVFEGDAYNTYPLKYTLVPIIGSLRWHMDDIAGRWILRGNWDLTMSGGATAIPRGAETRYYAYIMGIRRNFVPRNSRVAPYFDLRLGLGDIDARGPAGVKYAQGQDFTFTGNLGSGVRYNFNPRCAISAGLNYMHISNAGLSEPQVPNYGINVYGPMFGIDIQLRRRHEDSAQ